ncbi:hypothetical protein P7K49_006096 [Saguinus oedipus]|uniref:Uncharacterized protein n=1 Tax=Saguinus oedipus TaxID=9490 RepID=A0ABQ9W267_SAGOE|nr:hypothetical protein P7K49_006096 [Saguinus oedipus]
MADRRRVWNTEDDLPVYLARPGSAAQTPRQKYGGMFAAVEGAYENKTIDFDAYSVGRRGSARTPRSAGRPDAVGLPGPGGSEDTASDVSEPSGSAVSSPGEREERPPALRIRCPAPRDLPLGRDNGQGGGSQEDPGVGRPRGAGESHGAAPPPPHHERAPELSVVLKPAPPREREKEMVRERGGVPGRQGALYTARSCPEASSFGAVVNVTNASIGPGARPGPTPQPRLKAWGRWSLYLSPLEFRDY